MADPVAPPVDCELLHPTLPVPDIAAAVDHYAGVLGFRRSGLWGDPPTFASVELGNVSVHLTLGTANPGGCSIYFVVGDADQLFQFQQSRGAAIVTPPADRAWGLRDFSVRDRDGYTLTFGHRLPETGPPLPIERVDVALRLERRLAALLHDLAQHKGMSLGSCLEELVLHSFEPAGEGAAMPHTPSTLRHIEELKRKHGIDYDAHASYRFVER
jgi:catechol 2,3-dioxygenase-like lactoylglutathione lyase family enzyme